MKNKKQTPAPEVKPQRVNLTNKAGAGANPFASDVDAWLKIGWFRVENTPVAGANDGKATVTDSKPALG